MSTLALRCHVTPPLKHLLLPRCLTTAIPSSPPRPWSGLDAWRNSPPNPRRSWGPSGPSQTTTGNDLFDAQFASLAAAAATVLHAPDPLEKCRLTHLAFRRWSRRGGDFGVGLSVPPHRPSRPPNPILVEPKEIPSYKSLGMPLNAYMLHNLAHVELNAIDLAWDTVARFSPFKEELGEQFFADFARVADDESRHFSWCSQRLQELGFSYGDMPAHNFLWRECEKSSGDVAARLAVIPLVQEARGLDAGPRLAQRLVGFGDHRTSDIVAKIAEEEVVHVAVGVYWFLQVCEKTGRIPSAAFRDLLEEYGVEVKGPFNYSARDVAGIPRDWYDTTYNENPENSKLSEVHDRLASIISMERENSNLSR